ncbi:MAG: hypothetical protein DSY87_08150, partial [Methylococcus sp.]
MGPGVDEEHFRLITGFNDIFVVIACILLLVSVWWMGTELGAWFGPLLQTATAWGLAEYFTRKRRMALPSIILLIAFVAGVYATGQQLLLVYLLDKPGIAIIGSNETETGIAIISFVMALAARLHWLRFKVPITVAAGIASLVAGSISLLWVLVPAVQDWMTVAIFVSGVLVFMLAMRWDTSDILRHTRRSDVAFWLHLVAAPLLVHPVFTSLGVFEEQTALWQLVVIAVLYGIVALVSISVDRRALMVSALVYVLYAFSEILEHYGVVSLSFAFTAFIIGSGLLL